MKIKQNYSLFTIHYSLFVIRCITELHRVSVKRAPVAETGNRCRSRDAGNRRSNQSRRSLPESTVKASGNATRLYGSDCDHTAQSFSDGKNTKKVWFESGCESVVQSAGVPCGKEGIIV